jgi:hypothetical protein
MLRKLSTVLLFVLVTLILTTALSTAASDPPPAPVMSDEQVLLVSNDQDPDQNDTSATTTPEVIPALPFKPENEHPDVEPRKLTLDTKVKMDELGPIVLNTDGTMSRISNWDKMSQLEKDRATRLIVKRNKKRRAVLLEQLASEDTKTAEPTTATMAPKSEL